VTSEVVEGNTNQGQFVDLTSSERCESSLYNRTPPSGVAEERPLPREALHLLGGATEWVTVTFWRKDDARRPARTR
jgi:hypothetical protein